MGHAERTYLPAAGHEHALPLYDPLVQLLGMTAAHRKLLDQSELQPSFRVLDIGCGTGTLAVLTKRLHPTIEVIGIDPDPKALGRANRKAERAGARIRFERGFSQELPYPDASFDRVLSSFMFHHLQLEDKRKTLQEVRRVLKPGGSLHLLDFGGDARAQGWLTRFIHSSSRLRDNSEARVLALLNEAGFQSPVKVMNGAILRGLLRTSYYRASAPAVSVSNSAP